jgi:hypothetical protein
VATAVTLVATMMMLGLASLSVVDTQTAQSRKERVGESVFNLTEGALSAQTFVLGRLGTGTLGNQFPDTCNASSTSALCPNAASLAAAYNKASQKDFDPSSTNWSTQVRDNLGGGSFYDDATIKAAPRWDQNGDKLVWVKSTATVRGRTRAIVALINVEERHIEFPGYAIAGGWFETTNEGKKGIVDATGSLGVTVRCNKQPPSPQCLNYSETKGQLVPAGGYQLGYSAQTAITPDDLQALEDYAKAKGTYFSAQQGCPSNPNGQLVVVESGNCSYTNSAPPAAGQSKCCNSPTSPGLLIIKNGSLTLGGNIDFYGLVYLPNLNNSSGILIQLTGNAGIIGGAVVDGPGGISAGSNGSSGANNFNLKFDPRAFDNVSAAGTAGVVQNTWREIIPDD